MADVQTCYPTAIPPCTLLGGPENMKLLFDSTMTLMNQAALDNQADARRRMSNSSTVDHLVNVAGAMALLSSTQTGESENQQTVSPVRTATGDSIVGAQGIAADAVGTANASVAANIAQLMSAIVPIIAGTSAAALSATQILAATLAAVTAAAGTAAGNSSAPNNPAK